jgi:hypothetical protein
MSCHLSASFSQFKTFVASNCLSGSFLALVSSIISSTILTQPVLANNYDTFYFLRDYQETGYRLNGKFTARDLNSDAIISTDEVIDFEAFIENLNDGWQESIYLVEKKKIFDFHYDLNSYFSTDFQFRVDTIDSSNKTSNSFSDSIAPLTAKTGLSFPSNSSWQVDFTENFDTFQISDFIIAGIDNNGTGKVTFVEEGNGDNTTTPEASSLGGIILISAVIFGFKNKINNRGT